MKSARLFALIGVLCLASMAQAQTAPTRDTPCSPTTPWNAICLTFTPVTKYADGQDIPASDAITYKVERSAAATGTFAPQAATIGNGTAYVTNLAAGLHYFRMVARSTVYAADSAPSNVASKGLTSGVPAAPSITIAVLIEPGNSPLVFELTAQRDGDYRCRVVASPKRLNLRPVCQADVGG